MQGFWSSRRGRAIIALSTIAALVIATLTLTRDITNFTIAAVNEDSNISIDNISIDAPQNLSLPRCVTLTGSAPLNENATLWVAHTRTGGSEFYFWETSRVSPTATGWSAKVILGAENDEGRIYDIWAFFLPNDFNAFVTSLSARGMDGSSGYWFSRSLPPGVDEKPTLTVSTSNTSNEDCDN